MTNSVCRQQPIPDAKQANAEQFWEKCSMIVSRAACVSFALLVATSTSVAAQTKRAKPKPARAKVVSQICQAANSERRQLEADGVRELLKSDPKVARQILSDEKLANLRRLIELDEKIMFGCRLEPHPALARGRDATKATVLAKKSGKRARKFPAIPVRKPKNVRLRRLSAPPLPSDKP